MAAKCLIALYAALGHHRYYMAFEDGVAADCEGGMEVVGECDYYYLYQDKYCEAIGL